MRFRLTQLSILFLLAGCTTLVEVDKGLYDVANTVAKPDVVTGERTANLTTRTIQIEKGNSIAQEVIKQYESNI